MARLVIATLGSLGDLHPVLALAFGLRARGHHVEIATSEMYREKVGDLGFTFHPLRPDLLAGGEALVPQLMDGARGTERLTREYLFPAVRAMDDDLRPVLRGADALIASELIYAAPILSATLHIPWISYALAPVSYFSCHDPPILPAAAPLRWLQRKAGWLSPLAKQIARIVSHSWWAPVRDLRAAHGLAPGRSPLFEGKYSPALNLALFSRVLQSPQPDWPPHCVQCGFLFCESKPRPADSPLPPAVNEFLARGAPPVVFTLGSAAVRVPGNFYVESARAAEQLGRRALLLIGENAPPANLPASIVTWDYLPFAQIFPHAAAVVHQGGVGTTAQALRAGRPMLVMPFAHDQFDNAARIERLGAGLTLSRRRANAPRLARQLQRLLSDPRFERSAAALAGEIQRERGVETACAAIESALGRAAPARL